MSRFRSPRSTVALLCAALVGSALLLAPAAEAKAISRTVTIKATPNAAVGGTKVTFGGKLSKSPKGSKVKIQRKVGKKWVIAKATTTSTPAGAYATKVALPAKAGVYKYRAFAPKVGNRKAATSKVIAVASLRKTTFFKLSNRDFVMQSTGNGDPGSAIGRLNTPCTPGAAVTLQRKDAGVWKSFGTSTIQSNCLFKVDFPNAQSGEFRVYVARKGLNASALSITESYVFL